MEENAFYSSIVAPVLLYTAAIFFTSKREKFEKTQNLKKGKWPKCVKVEGLSIDSLRLKNEVEAFGTARFSTKKKMGLKGQKSGGGAYDGWNGVPLRSWNGDDSIEGLKYMGSPGNQGFDVQDTPALFHLPYVRELISNIESKFHSKVCFTRLMRLNAKGFIAPHNDRSKEHVARDLVRMHIPVITNPNVFFEVEGECYHLSSGNFYFTDTIAIHSVLNNSDEDRLHIILDCECTLELAEAILCGERADAAKAHAKGAMKKFRAKDIQSKIDTFFNRSNLKKPA